MVRRISGIKTITQDGEIHITLDLNINVVQGNIEVSATEPNEIKTPVDKPRYEIPDFTSGISVSGFGKEAK